MNTTHQEAIIIDIEAGLNAIEVIARAIHSDRRQESESLLFITDKIEQLLRELEEVNDEFERD